MEHVRCASKIGVKLGNSVSLSLRQGSIFHGVRYWWLKLFRSCRRKVTKLDIFWPEVQISTCDGIFSKIYTSALTISYIVHARSNYKLCLKDVGMQALPYTTRISCRKTLGGAIPCQRFVSYIMELAINRNVEQSLIQVFSDLVTAHMGMSFCA